MSPVGGEPTTPTDTARSVVGAVLCGGRSSRFGSDKALAPFGSSTVGARVVAALRNGGIDPVVAIGGTAGTGLGLPTVADLRPGQGPLGGLATALLWARTGWVLAAPCDLPLLEPVHVAALLAARPRPEQDEDRPVVAVVDGRPQPSLGCWPAGHGRRLLALVDGEQRALRAAIDGIEWLGVELPADALADADTPEELARLDDGAL